MVVATIGWLGAGAWIPGASRALAHGALHQQLVDVSSQLAADPDNFDLLIRRGELQRLHQSWGDARADFEKARSLRPDDLEPVFRLGRLELEAENPVVAARWLQATLDKKPHHIEAALLLARACVRTGKPGQAVEHFNTAVHWSREPRPEWFIERSAAILAAAPSGSKEGLKLATASLDEGLELVGPVPTLQLAAIELEVKAGRIDAALKRLDAIRNVSERKEQWWFRRGLLLEQAGRATEATAAFQSARSAIDSLPERQQRTLAMTEMKRDLEKHLRNTRSATTPATPIAP